MGNRNKCLCMVLVICTPYMFLQNTEKNTNSFWLKKVPYVRHYACITLDIKEYQNTGLLQIGLSRYAISKSMHMHAHARAYECTHTTRHTHTGREVLKVISTREN